MIKGKAITLRPVRESDLDELFTKSIDIESRGPWFPHPESSLGKMRKTYAENGWWSADYGQFAAVDDTDRLVAHVLWWKLNGSIGDTELGYRVFDPADRGKGIASEAVDLLAGWLFDSYPLNRLQLVIHVENAASHRVAEKCGYTKETTARGAWYHKGAWQDVDVFTMTRAQFDQRRDDGPVAD
ncbi:MAG TPA: GNAT family protein [Candidatus Limnocylindrales bacterium]|jgi:RimJ/RimL family protein N-acetyltransferase